MVQSEWDRTVFAGVLVPTAILKVPNFSFLLSSGATVYIPDRTWSRSTNHPARMLVHSPSGNCGKKGELRREDLANLRSRAKFARATWVCRSSVDKDAGLICSWITHANLSGSMCRLYERELESSSDPPGDRLHLDGALERRAPAAPQWARLHHR